MYRARATLLAGLLVSAMVGFPGASVAARQPAARTIRAPESFTAATLEDAVRREPGRRRRVSGDPRAGPTGPATARLRPARRRPGGRGLRRPGHGRAGRGDRARLGHRPDHVRPARATSRTPRRPAVPVRSTAEAGRLAPGRRIAVIAWLGYDAPRTLSLAITNDRRARAGGVDLGHLVASLRRPGVAVSLLCHSYGSVVCAHAARREPVTELVVFGSPGLPFRSAAALGAGRVWATRGSADWIKRVPKLRITLFGRQPRARSRPGGPRLRRPRLRQRTGRSQRLPAAGQQRAPPDHRDRARRRRGDPGELSRRPPLVAVRFRPPRAESNRNPPRQIARSSATR